MALPVSTPGETCIGSVGLCGAGVGCGVALTTGNAFTVGMGIEALRRAAAEKKIALAGARLGAVGAAGNICSTYLRMMAEEVGRLRLIGRAQSHERLAKVAALLLLDSMDGPTAVEQLRLTADRLLDRFPRWAKSYRGEDGPGQLVTDALAVLTAFGLVRSASGVATPLPAAARYTVGDPRSAESGDTPEEVPS